MSDPGASFGYPYMPPHASKAVFLSYAREDTDATRRIADALQAFGVEVWIDQSELRGGDAWDQNIRRQIKECALFVPIISAHTQERGEGYFRLEWSLAEERALHFAKGVPFVVPVVVDDTLESGASVPEVFLRVHWTRLPKGVPSPQFIEHIQGLLSQARKPATSVGLDTSTMTSSSLGRSPWSRFALLGAGLALAAGVAWWELGSRNTPGDRPVVVLMDSTYEDRVYDDTTKNTGGSNADDITDALRGLPIDTIKEGTNSHWNREAEVQKENPALIVIHRSAFFTFPERMVGDLYPVTDNKLVAFMGYIATVNPRTRFIVYSRKSWEDAVVAAKWREDAASRFPALADRIETWRVPLDRATFRNALTAQELRDSVVKQLGLKVAPRT